MSNDATKILIAETDFWIRSVTLKRYSGLKRIKNGC